MIFYYIKKSFLVYRNCFLKEFDRFETEPICQILYLLPRSLLSEVSSSHIIQGKIYKPPPPLWKLPLGSSHFPSQISILVNLSKHVSSNPRVESSVPLTTVIWHTSGFILFPSQPQWDAPFLRAGSRKQKQRCVQDPNFPASPRWAQLWSARKHLAYFEK